MSFVTFSMRFPFVHRASLSLLGSWSLAAFLWVSPLQLLGGPSYKAQKGDSYYVIAKRFNLNYLELSRLNENKSLRAGSSIRLPEIKTYRVQSGDSWSELALAFRVSQKELMNANPNLTLLKTGTIIKLPLTSTASTRSKTTVSAPRTNTFVPLPVFQPRFVWPVSGTIRKGFGAEGEIMNYGLLLSTTQKKVLASEQGLVAFVGHLRGLGKTVLITHPDGYVSLYAGLAETFFERGQLIEKGRLLGQASSGQIFFSIWNDGDPADPGPILRGLTTSSLTDKG